jgi:hypothetical protein
MGGGSLRRNPDARVTLPAGTDERVLSPLPGGLLLPESLNTLK